MRFIEIEQTRSAIRRNGRQRLWLASLGLGRIGRVRWVADTASNRGLIKKVSHLIRINHDPAAPPPDQRKPEYDEAADVGLLRRLAFDPNGIVPERYSDAELKSGKTPDFKLLRDGKLHGFCELKSPKDDYVFGPPNEKGFAVRENVPHYRKLGSHIRHAAEQFKAKNPEHKLPNIMVFVNHAPDLERRDLIATIAGLAVPGGPSLGLLGTKMWRQVADAARGIDLFLWIDAKSGEMKLLSVNGAPHQKEALELFDLRNVEAE